MSMPIDKNYFQMYKGDCDVFVETGTHVGNGITLAVQAGFLEIHSIDILDQIPQSYKHGLKNIHRYIGDSAEVLKTLLPKLKGKKVFAWLDAHSQMTEGEEDNYPLLSELEEIRKSGISDATILIDDFLYMSHPLVTGWNSDKIISRIKAINPAYEITYLSNPIRNNILMARV